MITDFFAEESLSFDQVTSLTSAMYAVAKVDGVHERELALIREFYDGCSRAGDPSLDEVVGANFDIEAASSLFSTPELAQLFIKSLILLAFADGTYARLEDELIRGYAREMKLVDDDVDRLHSATKEYLLTSLAHVQNLEALAAVAKKLDLN